MPQAVKVLNYVAKHFGHSLHLRYICAGDESIQKYGSPLLESAYEDCMAADAVLLGNTGLKKYQHHVLQQRPEYVLFRLRKGLGLTTNIRPIKIYSQLQALSPLKEHICQKGLNMLFVRDIAGGILSSKKVSQEGVHGREAFEYEYYNEEMISHSVQRAFCIARSRKKTLRVLDKSNVLESSRLWKNVVLSIAEKNPDIQVHFEYIDTASMYLISRPHIFDVILTTNIFGDIIADEGTELTGTPYLFASAELSPNGKCLFTPNQLHNPDEDSIGKDITNPLGQIASLALLFRYCYQLEDEASLIERALETFIAKGYRTQDLAKKEEVWVPCSSCAKIIIDCMETE